jgi:hypothetical protein
LYVITVNVSSGVSVGVLVTVGTFVGDGIVVMVAVSVGITAVVGTAVGSGVAAGPHAVRITTSIRIAVIFIFKISSIYPISRTKI